MKNYHTILEKNSFLLLICSLIVIAIGGLVEIAPLFRLETTIEEVEGVRPYTPLELAGQNIYIREGCYNCHSQQIRPLRDEVERYGHYSLAAESMYDHPFQWGSKRTWPDLARIGGKYSDTWHVAHLKAPRKVVPGSIMPGYGFLAQQDLKIEHLSDRLKALSRTGVPYSQKQIQDAKIDAQNQADSEAENEDELIEKYGEKLNIRDFDGNPDRLTEMDALVAYLQMLGTLVDPKKLSKERIVR